MISILRAGGLGNRRFQLRREAPSPLGRSRRPRLGPRHRDGRLRACAAGRREDGHRRRAAAPRRCALCRLGRRARARDPRRPGVAGGPGPRGRAARPRAAAAAQHGRSAWNTWWRATSSDSQAPGAPQIVARSRGCASPQRSSSASATMGAMRRFFSSWFWAMSASRWARKGFAGGRAPLQVVAASSPRPARRTPAAPRPATPLRARRAARVVHGLQHRLVGGWLPCSHARPGRCGPRLSRYSLSRSYRSRSSVTTMADGCTAAPSRLSLDRPQRVRLGHRARRLDRLGHDAVHQRIDPDAACPASR